MGRIIAVHSYKGGTGKTLFAVNLAGAFAKQGKKVALMDLDFRAPSLFAILNAKETQFWMNDYLNGTCEINKVLIDISYRIGNAGKWYAGLANPSTEAIRDMSAKDRKWEMRALGRLLSLKNLLSGENGLDYLVFDTSPGLQYSSINAIVAADLVLVATTNDRSDVDGTKRMVRELYNLFEKKTAIVLNKAMDTVSRAKKDELNAKIKDAYQVPLLAAVPCFCDILRAEGGLVFPQDKPDHPFTRILTDMTHKIEMNQIE
jgi:MinD-like ATPase involved in chromosome partitioning or flagellar assembly